MPPVDRPPTETGIGIEIETVDPTGRVEEEVQGGRASVTLIVLILFAFLCFAFCCRICSAWFPNLLISIDCMAIRLDSRGTRRLLN